MLIPIVPSKVMPFRRPDVAHAVSLTWTATDYPNLNAALISLAGRKPSTAALGWTDRGAFTRVQ